MMVGFQTCVVLRKNYILKGRHNVKVKRNNNNLIDIDHAWSVTCEPSLLAGMCQHLGALGLNYACITLVYNLKYLTGIVFNNKIGCKWVNKINVADILNFVTLSKYNQLKHLHQGSYRIPL